jgi:hypothetical protein
MLDNDKTFQRNNSISYDKIKSIERINSKNPPNLDLEVTWFNITR